MFCSKCGKQIADDADFCDGCGIQVGASTPPQAVYMPWDGYKKYGNVWLTLRERGFIVAAGVIYIVMGVLSGIFMFTSIAMVMGVYSYVGTAASVTAPLSFLFYLVVFVAVAVCVFFGIMILLNKRWALIVVWVLMIICGVLSVINLIKHIAEGRIDRVIADIINIGYSVMMICFLNIGISALRRQVQYLRHNSNTSPCESELAVDSTNL